MTTPAFGANAADKPLEPMQITRRPPGPQDVQIDIAFCGVCHSDLHQVRSEWGGTRYPCVPGHEIVGQVTAIGDKVTRCSVGDTVGVGRELVNVIDPRSMRFEGLVSADRMGELKTGQPVSFRVNGHDDGDFRGVVRRIDASANAATRQLAVLVDFVDPGKAPRVAGLYAEGSVETGASEVLMLPEGTLVRAGEATYAWRAAGGTLQKVALRLGERDPRSGDFPVLSGLAAGDRVLRSPGSSLVEGQAFEMAAVAGPAAASSAPAAAR